MDFKNTKQVAELFDIGQIKYTSWVYTDDTRQYFDLIITDNMISVVGEDIITDILLKHIVYCGAYFGPDEEEYDENYFHAHPWHWRFGTGGMLIYLADLSGREWRIVFNVARFEDAKKFYVCLRNIVNREDN